MDFQLTLSYGAIAMIREKVLQVCYLKLIWMAACQSDLVAAM